ncbi:MAG: ATP-binding protein [Thermodesulfobacteriota bacterium]
MKIAVVGGGSQSLELMELMERHSFKEIDPVIIAVADPDPNAPAMVRAGERGLFVTCDYSDFFDHPGIELIIELSDSMDIYNDILSRKKPNTGALCHTTARLFWELSHVTALHEGIKQELQEAKALNFVMSNKMIQEEMMIISPDYVIQDVNAALLKRFGKDREAVIGRHCYEITHNQSFPCSGDLHPCPLKQVLEDGRPSQTTHIHQDDHGNQFYHSISGYPLFEGDRIVGVIEIAKDITRDLRLQNSMMQQEKMASIGRLSAGVAHEINNPLTTILTSAMLIQEEMEPDNPIYEEIKTIAKEALRCRKIVKSLLEFARQTPTTRTAGSINDVGRESHTLTRKHGAFHDVTVTADLAGDLPLVDIDKDQMQQALINLMMNAIEATPPGGRVSLSTRFLPDEDTVEVTVTDTGKGIDPENADKVFEPFFTTRSDGNGLGLAITHGIIEQHGGTITFDSKPGEGTCFRIRLPIYKEEVNDD